jgi:hypothetical protein
VTTSIVDVVPEIAPDVRPEILLGLAVLVILIVGLIWLIREIKKLNDSIDRVLGSALGRAATAF